MEKFNSMELAAIRLDNKIELKNDLKLTSAAIFPIPFDQLAYLPKEMFILDRYAGRCMVGRAYNQNCIAYYRNSDSMGVIECSDGSFYIFHPEVSPEPDEDNWDYIQAIAKGYYMVDVFGNSKYYLTHVYVNPNTIPEAYKSSKLRYITRIISVIILNIFAIFELAKGGFFGFDGVLMALLCVVIALPIVISIYYTKYKY